MSINSTTIQCRLLITNLFKGMMAAPMTFRKWSSCIRYAKQFLNARFHLRNVRGTWMSSTANETPIQNSEKDPFPVYASSEVQSILRRMAGFDLIKLAGPKKVPFERPVYKLLTDDELANELESARKQLARLLDNPPPYMNPRKPVKEPLAVDPDLAHFDTSKYVFSDISFGVKDRDRSVVVREVDGTLRVAPWDVRERMNQIYNPREGRSVIRPQVFDEVHMERLISEGKFVYILDRACGQFEPDDPDFLRTCRRVYSAVNTSHQFEALRSTRFFAPMAFHLVWTKMVDSLLADMLNRDLGFDALDLLGLYCMVHPDGECSVAVKDVYASSVESAVKAFLETESQAPVELELALQGFLDRKGTEHKDSLVS